MNHSDLEKNKTRVVIYQRVKSQRTIAPVGRNDNKVSPKQSYGSS